MTVIARTFSTARPFVGPANLLLYAAIGAASVPIWPFSWHLGLHVIGAVLLIGNAAVMAVWLTLAGFRGSDRTKRSAARAVNVADAWFTVPGVMLLLANGIAMANQRYGGFPALFGVDFIVVGLALLTGTGVIWGLRLLPIQLALHRLATAEGDLDRSRFQGLLTRWYVWGTIATVLPILAVVAMSAKPNLW